jgi:hypothetical protein
MNFGSFAIPAAVLGLSYFDYKDKKDRQKELDRRYEAYRNLKGSQPASSGGGGGGGGGGGKRAMANAISGGYGRANELLAPYVEAGKKILPMQTAAYEKALPGFENFAGQVLNQDFLRNALMFNRPEQAALPATLVGGK